MEIRNDQKLLTCNLHKRKSKRLKSILGDAKLLVIREIKNKVMLYQLQPSNWPIPSTVRDQGYRDVT